jgi:hypothetical protein
VTGAAVLATLMPGAAATNRPLGPHVPGRVLVRFASGATQPERDRALASVRGIRERTIPAIGVEVVRVPVEVEDALASLAGERAVTHAEADFLGRVALTPEDPCMIGCIGARQWNVDAVNARAGWDVVPARLYSQEEKRASTPVKVAVLDTKIDEARADWINRDALPSNAPYDAREGGQLDVADANHTLLDPSEWDGVAAYHGTFVAGILAAAAGNRSDIAGLAYSAQVMPVTVVDGHGRVRSSDLAEGIVWAWQHGARVINLSLGMDEYSQTVQDAIYTATRSTDGRPGALVVAAAGNNGNDLPFYPAQMASVMAVSAVDEADRRGACSNHNAKISVAAPGVNVLSLDPRAAGGLSVAPCGTSTAAPHVSALAALLVAQDPARTPLQVRGIIESTADDVNAQQYPGGDEFTGRGRINFQRALTQGSGLPVVDQVQATIPRAIGGQSQATAIGRATAPKQILQAEWFVDELGAPGSGGEVQPADGAFDDPRGEPLTATITVPIDLPMGVHRLYMRARDADGWGAAAVGALIVDRKPPLVEKLTAATAVPAAGVASEIRFEVRDDYSTQATYVVTVTRSYFDTSALVFQSQPKTIDVPSAQITTWLPALTDAGIYTIKVTVVDQGLNPGKSETMVLVL